MTTPRDTQRAKLYAAERFAWTGAATIGELTARGDDWYTDGSLTTAADAQAYVNAALALPAIRTTFGRSAAAKVEVYYGGRGATGSYEGRIRLGTQTRSKWVALHELAHVITGRYYGTKTAVHGPLFASVYLFLVRNVMGDRPADDLRAAFDLHGVGYSKVLEPVTDC